MSTHWFPPVFVGMMSLSLLNSCRLSAFVEVPNAPRHRADRAHTEADYDEATTFDNYFGPEAGNRSGPGGTADAQTVSCLVCCVAPPHLLRGRAEKRKS